MLVYGKPGDGKTYLIESLNNLEAAPIFVPHAIDCQGNIVQRLRPHLPRARRRGGDRRSWRSVARRTYDRRWVQCKRPFIVSGGELTLDMLDLRYNADLQGLRSAVPAEGQQRHLSDRRLRPPARRSRRGPEPLDRAHGAARRLPQLHDRRQDDRAVRGVPGLLHEPQSRRISATRRSCAASSTRCCCAARRENEFVRIFENALRRQEPAVRTPAARRVHREAIPRSRQGIPPLPSARSC